MSDTVRTFIAIELPPEVRAFLTECQERLNRAGGDVRWVRPDLIHLTLVFLGEVPADMLGDLEQAAREALAGFAPLELRVSGAGHFPPRGAPRVVWIGIEDLSGRLMAVQAALAKATGAFAEKVEDRAYTAHLTLGRVRSPKGARDLTGAVDAMSAHTGPTFSAGEVTIFKSELSPQGPAYTALGRISLGAPGIAR
jgi:2'-5' RNA ligase